VAGKAFDFSEIVRGEEDGGFGGTFEKAFDELIADERIEAAEGLVENDEAGMKGEGAGESEFHFHTAGEGFDFAVERKIELLDEGLLEGEVSGGIETAEIVEKRADFHPFGDFLIFGDIADLGVGLATEFAGIGAEDLGSALAGGDEIHEDFDSSGFSGAVLANESVDGAFLDFEIDVVKSSHAAVVFGERVRSDYGCHCWRPPWPGPCFPSLFEVRRAQCLAMASCMS